MRSTAREVLLGQWLPWSSILQGSEANREERMTGVSQLQRAGVQAPSQHSLCMALKFRLQTVASQGPGEVDQAIIEGVQAAEGTLSIPNKARDEELYK